LIDGGTVLVLVYCPSFLDPREYHLLCLPSLQVNASSRIVYEDSALLLYD
jgi:hypothetical protein